MQTRAILLTCLTLFVAVGCSSFDRDWKQAAGQEFQGMEGRWIGRWHSDHNQHNGVLRCLVTKTEGDTYHTRFHAKYKWGILTVSYPYDMDMTLTQNGSSYQFTGEADLGKLAGGVYQYNGTGTTNRIEINYRSPKDHGTFKLDRPEDTE